VYYKFWHCQTDGTKAKMKKVWMGSMMNVRAVIGLVDVCSQTK
jgi:hypothetical protein